MANIYNIGKENLENGTLDFDVPPTDIRAILLRSDGGFVPVYEPDNVTVADMLAQGGGTGNEEISVGGYSRQVLGSLAVSSAAGEGRAAAQKSTFSALVAGQTVSAAVLYKGDSGAGDATTNEVFAFFNFADVPTNGGDIELRYSGTDGVGFFLKNQAGSNIYDISKEGMINGLIDWDNGGDTYRCLLWRSDGGGPATFDGTDVSVVDFLAPATSVEVTAGGYARQDVTGRTATAEDTGDTADGDAAKAVFTAVVSGQTVGGAMVYKFITNDTDSRVVAFYDLTDTPTNGGNIEVLFDNADPGTAIQLIE